MVIVSSCLYTEFDVQGLLLVLCSFGYLLIVVISLDLSISVVVFLFLGKLRLGEGLSFPCLSCAILCT